MNIEDMTNAERETHLNMSADDRGTWQVYSDDPVMQRRMEKVGATLVKTEAHGGKHYTMRADQVLLRLGKRKVSEAQRKVLADRLSSLRSSSTGDADTQGGK